MHESAGNVANHLRHPPSHSTLRRTRGYGGQDVQVLPITNTNSQLGSGNVANVASVANNQYQFSVGECGTRDWKLENGTGNIGNTGNIKKSSTCSTQLKNISAPSASPREIITQTAQAILAAYGLAPDTPEPEIVAHLFKFYAEQSGQEE